MVSATLLSSSFSLSPIFIYTVPGWDLTSHGYRSDDRNNTFGFARHTFVAAVDGYRSDYHRNTFNYGRNLSGHTFDSIAFDYTTRIFREELDSISRYEAHLSQARECPIPVEFDSIAFDYTTHIFRAELDSISCYEAHLSQGIEYPMPYPSY